MTPRINRKVLAHAQRMKHKRGNRKVAQEVDGVLDDELGDFFGDLLGGIPLIGGLISGATGGGASKSPAPNSGTAPTSGSGGLTLEGIRSIVQDALGGNRDIVERAQLGQAGIEQGLRKAGDTILGNIAPGLAQAHGAVQVQRLQSQATAEHNALNNRAARERLGSQRHAEIMAKLETIITKANAISSGVTGPARAILNLH